MTQNPETPQTINHLPVVKNWEIVPKTVDTYLRQIGDTQTTDAYLASRRAQDERRGVGFDDIRWAQRQHTEYGESDIAHARRILWEELFGVDVGIKHPDKPAIATIGGIVSHDWEENPSDGSTLKKLLDNPSLKLADTADEKLTLAVTEKTEPITNAELIRHAWVKLSGELMHNQKSVPNEHTLPLDPNSPDGLLVILRTHPSLAQIFEHASTATALNY